MLEIANLHKRYGPRVVFEKAAAFMSPNVRIGLVGPNGCGKTTLLRMVAGEEDWEGGDIRLKKGCKIGYLPQDLAELPGATISESVHRGEYPEYVAERLLSGLGFASDEYKQPPDSFSGGFRMRVALAHLLIAEPDILLMDEPTNHLDRASCRWLEQFLRDTSTAVLMVSHDTEFLDRTVTHIWEVYQTTLRPYTGNYSRFIRQREARQAQLESAAKSQQRKVDKLERFVDRFRSKASKASQVQSRIKELDKVKTIELERKTRGFQFTFPKPPASGHSVLKLDHIAKRYEENIVYRDFNLEIERGERVALVGENGAGKTTLLKILAGVLDFEKGTRTVGHNATLHYFAQHQSEALNLDHNIIDSLHEVAELAETADTQYLRNVAGAFLFSGEDQFKRISVLSGGEKARVALARMLIRPTNTLLLDEPTNHLDPRAVDVITDALSDFPGTIVFISHDPTFLMRMATRVVHIEQGVPTLYPGGYEYYLWKRRDLLAEDAEIASAPAPKAKKAPAKPSEGARRYETAKALKSAKRKLDRLEKAVAELEISCAEQETELASEGAYEDYELWAKLEATHREARASLDRNLADWQAQAEEVERLDQVMASFE